MLVSCGRSRKAERVLDDVASYIQEAPDSAFATIKAIDTLDLASKRARAKYSLMLSMALDKNYIDTTDISVAMPAVRYYESHGDPDTKLKALYYLGRIYYNGGSLTDAVTTLTKALQYTDRAEDKKYVEMLYTMIAVIYNNNYNHEEALPYFKKAYETLEGEPGLEEYAINALCNLGIAYYTCLQFDESERILRSLVERDDVPSDIKGRSYGMLAMRRLAPADKNEKEGLELFNKAFEHKAVLDRNQWAAYAYALDVLGDKAKSEAIFNKLISSSDSSYIASACYWRSLAKEKHRNYESALEDYKTAMEVKNKTLRLALTQSTSGAQRDYYEAQSKMEKEQLKTQRFSYWSIILVLVIVALGVMMIVVVRSHRIEDEKNKLAELASISKAQIKEAENNTGLLRTEIDEKDRALAAMKSEYARMYKEKFSYLAKLCETYYSTASFKEPDKRIIHQVKSMIADIGSDKNGQRRLEKMMDRDLDNIMKHFREDFPNYNEEDYRFVSYVIIGFDSVTIMAVMQMPTAASVYARKSRIKKVIQESSSPHKDLYLQMFS